MLPAMALSICASVGSGLVASSAVADISCPDWQYPHCATSWSIQACCSAESCSPLAKPSTVVTFIPETALTGI